MLKKIFVFSLSLGVWLFFLFSGRAFTQEEAKPIEPATESVQSVEKAPEEIPPVEKSLEEKQKEMEIAIQGMQQMGPAMSQMMDQMFDTMFTYLAQKETAMKLATFTRNYYVALVKAGFTKEEALQIVIQSGIPNLGSK